jgi:hypothetical protein
LQTYIAIDVSRHTADGRDQTLHGPRGSDLVRPAVARLRVLSYCKVCDLPRYFVDPVILGIFHDSDHLVTVPLPAPPRTVHTHNLSDGVPLPEEAPRRALVEDDRFGRVEVVVLRKFTTGDQRRPHRAKETGRNPIQKHQGVAARLRYEAFGVRVAVPTAATHGREVGGRYRNGPRQRAEPLYNFPVHARPFRLGQAGRFQV